MAAPSRPSARLAAALLATSLLGVVTLLPTQPATAAAAAGPAVTGSGSLLAALLMNQWRADVARPPLELDVSYSAAGSKVGRERFIAEAVDFAVSEVAFPAAEQAALAASGRASSVVVPVAAAPLAFMFNVVGTNGARITDLRLTAADACRIFTEPAIRWDDPSIAATNPGRALPPRAIRPVVRADESGESLALGEFCLARAPDVWLRFIALASALPGADADFRAGRPSSSWPVGFGMVSSAVGSSGVANAVAGDTVLDAVTYVEPTYTSARRLPAAAVQNPAGAFTGPSSAAGTLALAGATRRADGTFAPANLSTDPNVYVPVTVTYAIAQTDGFDPSRGTVVASFLDHVVCQGQSRSAPLLYAELPTPLVDAALDAISGIPGAPPRPSTTACQSSPAPPAVIPEAPLAVLLPVVALLTGAVGLVRSRRRRSLARH